jgi:UDP-4-amino-4,6-dideoxy-N-acetyl-beta-L-altrosamine transaminase
MNRLAIEGGRPVRGKMLPYGHQSLDERDIQAVAGVLRSERLTCGPLIEEFERDFAEYAGSRYAVAVSNGTAALHAALDALEIGPGDEVIVPAITFAASANCVVFQGGRPVFADVEPDTLLLNPEDAAGKITSRTKAIIAVDYAGHPCHYTELTAIADRNNVRLVADACHALGGAYQGRPVGSLALLSAFSFHPVKHIATGEGGMITTDDPLLARRMRTFRNHGITSDDRQREREGSWFYEMVGLGYNYRLTDFQCALGVSQLKKAPTWLARRQAIAERYDRAFVEIDVVKPLSVRPGVTHAYHLYVVRLDLSQLRVGRGTIFQALRAEGIGVNVHYIPVYLHPYYQKRFAMVQGLCPVAEEAYESIISLPLWPGMADADVGDVVTAVRKVLAAYRK